MNTHTTTTTTNEPETLTLDKILEVRKKLGPPPDPFEGITHYAMSAFSPNHNFLFVRATFSRPGYVICHESEEETLLDIKPSLVKITTADTENL